MTLIQVFEKAIAKSPSMLIEKKKSFPAENLVDGKLSTSWCEGVPGPGIGQILEIQTSPKPIIGLSVLGGFGESRDLYLKNNRVQDYEVVFTTKSGEKITKKGKFANDHCLSEDERNCTEYESDEAQYNKCIENLSKYCVEGFGTIGENIELGSVKCISKVEFKILSVHKGSKYDDTCIAEIQLLLPNKSMMHKFSSEFDKVSKTCK
jgi:hypothetical protein